MVYTLWPNGNMEEAVALLEEHGVFGAVEKYGVQLKLYKRESSRIDPTTGEEIVFRPEERMTDAIRKKLEEMGWKIRHSSEWEGGYGGFINRPVGGPKK
jgi:hypothetical protein